MHTTRKFEFNLLGETGFYDDKLNCSESKLFLENDSCNKKIYCLIRTLESSRRIKKGKLGRSSWTSIQTNHNI